MVRSITDIKRYLLQIATRSQLPQTNKCIFELLLNDSSLDNEEIVELLIKDYKLAHINATTANIAALNFEKLNEYYIRGYFIFETTDKKTAYAVNNIAIIKEQKLDNINAIPTYLVRKNDLLQILERDFAIQNTHHAINYVTQIPPNISAKSINYIKMVTGFGMLFFASCFLFINAFCIINSCLHLIQNFLKIILFKQVAFVTEEESPIALMDNNLPIYSVLIPLYHEELKLESIVNAMANMNYPKDKLDVKLLIEADDISTIQELTTIDLPPYIQIIKVPYSLPRTKPKALNYAMPFVRGKILTIYDAEDLPDPDQLLKAIYAFNNLPEEFVCIQAKLNFYNSKENLLTRFFSLEYSIWFECLLKGLSMLDLPVTLGGTSNHFKVDKLKEVGCWDAYNVTEDAELGIRLYLNGYKVHLINSTTMEESPTNISIWLAQRARWIKGFLQTIYIFIKSKKNLKTFGPLKICTVYIFVGLATYSFFCLPWIILALTLNNNYFIYYMWLVTATISLSYIYSIATFILLKNKQSFSQFAPMEWVTLLAWPLYFILHTIASYRAIWEALVSPFKWNKTPHGKSSE